MDDQTLARVTLLLVVATGEVRPPGNGDRQVYSQAHMRSPPAEMRKRRLEARGISCMRASPKGYFDRNQDSHSGEWPKWANIVLDVRTQLIGGAQ